MTWLVSLLNQVQVVSAYSNLLTLPGLTLLLGLSVGLMDGILLVIRQSDQEETTGIDSRRGWFKAVVIGVAAGGAGAAADRSRGEEDAAG